MSEKLDSTAEVMDVRRDDEVDHDVIVKEVFGAQDLSRSFDSDPALGGFWKFTREELERINIV